MKLHAYKGRCNLSGQNIRRIRMEQGLTQEQLAAKLQVYGLPLTQKAISRIESGDRIVADYELIYLSMALRVSQQALLEE